jgi:predicted aspartyl protease
MISEVLMGQIMRILVQLPRWFLIGGVLLVVSTSIAEEIYIWTDESGTIHFADSLQKIPPEFRKQVETKRMGKSPSSPKSNSTEEGETLRSAPNPPMESPAPSLDRENLQRHEISFKPFEGSARRIIVDVTFNGSVTAPMAIDTGAPDMVISPELAERLGVFNKDQEKLIVTAGGIGGKVPAILTIIDQIQIGGAKGRFLPTTVTPTISQAFQGLVGMDFVSNFSMKVDWKKKVVILEEIPPDPALPGGHDEQWWRGLYQDFGSMHILWRDYERFLNDRIESSLVTTGAKIELMKEMKVFAAFQSKEADRLLSKLDRYANQHFVPREWRQY